MSRIWSLTHLIVSGCVDDLVSCNVSIGLCRLRPAELSDSWADDVKGQATWFTRRWEIKNIILRKIVTAQTASCDSVVAKECAKSTQINRITIAKIDNMVFQGLDDNIFFKDRLTKTAHEQRWSDVLVITIFHCFTGNNVCFVAISYNIVGTHSHLVVTTWVEFGQLCLWTLHI